MTGARLLVKTAVTGQSVRVTPSEGAILEFTIQPLGASVSGSSASALSSSGEWYLWTLMSPLTLPTVWDACHEVAQGQLSFDGAAPVDGASVIQFAEPDNYQAWGVGLNRSLALVVTNPNAPSAPEDARYPTDPDPFWFRDQNHAQFGQIPALDGAITDRVRVAHLDTGYDPNHETLPRYLNHQLERNFVDSDHPDSAVDDSTGLLANLGHGTGTLGILAGSPVNGQELGGAPDVEVVPIRVANSVILFYNSAVADALLYVLSLCQDSSTRIHVVSMSMGGLACQAWAEAVNQLYDAGVFVVAASGDNFGNLPIRTTVYPALFQRVVAACGVMADSAPYADLPIDEMAGNYGPPDKMATAMAAYSPNVPWARLGGVDIIDYNGSGTSAATPQIAAAAANWIQRHKAEWDGYPENWMRVEAVRKALFDSAAPADVSHCGRGLLRAADALDQPGAPASDLVAQPEDTVMFPLLGLIPAAARMTTNDIQQRMLHLEALQLAQSSFSSEGLLDVQSANTPARSRGRVNRARVMLAAHPHASSALRNALQTNRT